MRFLRKSAGRLRIASLAATFMIAGAQAWAQQGLIDHSQGFAGETDLTLNGTASGAASPAIINGTFLQLTNGTGTLARSAFHTTTVPVGNFQTKFTFHLLKASTGATTGKADGMGFCVQGVGPTALGVSGGDQGYGGIGKSVFIKFDNYQNQTVYSTTGMYQNGASPTNTTNDINCDPTIDFQGEDDFSCFMNYDGTTLTVTITDLSTSASLTQTYTVNIPSLVGAATGYVGFCAGTGGLTSLQEVMTWAYGVGLPPTGLTVTDGYNQETLNWTAPAPAPASYIIYRGTTSGGPYTQIGTSTTPTFTDTTATFPYTYYYVVVAVGSLGNSLFSNQATGIPLQPLVQASPTSVSVAENGGTTSFTVTANKTPWSGSFQVTVSSTNTAQVLVGTAGPVGSVVLTFQSSGPASQIVTVTGVDDFIAGDPQTVTVTVGAIQNSTDTTNYPNGWKPNDVPVSVLETDNPGILVGPPSGPVVDGGTAVTFAVTLNSSPAATTSPPPPTPGTVVLDVINSAPQVCTVTPTTLTFNSGNWNQTQLVTITPLNDNGQNPAVFFSVQSVTVTLTPDPLSTDPVYAALGPVSVTAPFVDPNQPPTLPKVWNGSGGGGGCGLTGLEALVLIGMAAGWRRRRGKP